MNETETAPAVPKDYPESWDEHAQAQAEGDRTIKLKDGQSVRCHIISGPLTYREMYVETGVDEKTGKTKKKRIALPFAAQLPGFKLKAKYIIEVVVLDGPSKGQHKLLEFGKQIADGLEEIKKAWGSSRVPDILISRKGSGQFDTEYFTTAAPATMKVEDNPVQFNLESEVRFSTAEDIKSLPRPVAVPVGDTRVGVTTKQVDFIDSLCKSKELTVKALKGILERKFNKGSVGELSSADASVLIETLQGM